MRVYRSRVHSSYPFKDETITPVTDGDFQQGSTAVVAGQWTVRAYTGFPKAMTGTITKLEGIVIELFVGEKKHYW